MNNTFKQVEDLHAIINELQKENKSNQSEIKQLTMENSELHRKNTNLRLSLQGHPDAARESEEDEEAPQLVEEQQTSAGGGRAGHHQSAMSMLIEETLADYDPQTSQRIERNRNPEQDRDRSLQKESEFEEERLEFTRNDHNITKDKHYVAWKEKALSAKQEAAAAKEENVALRRERTRTVEQVHSLEAKVAELESSNTTQITGYESQMEMAKLKISEFKQKHEESERIRKDSISTLHENLFSKLLEAEAEHEEMVGDYKQNIQDLQGQNQQLQTLINAMGTQKVETVVTLESMMQQLRTNVAALSKQNEHLQGRVEELESRSAVQNITASFGRWMG